MPKINMDRKAVIKFITFILIIIILLTTAFYLKNSFTFASFSQLLNNYGAIGPIIFIIFSLLSVLLFLPLTPINLAAGALFNVFLATIYMAISSTLAAIILFYLARWLGQPFVEKVLTKKMAKFSKLREEIKEKEFITVFLSRFMPIFPFTPVSLILGLTEISFTNYLLGTILGSLPWTFVYIYFSHSLIKLEPIPIVLASFLIIAGVGFYFYSHKKWYKK